MEVWLKDEKNKLYFRFPVIPMPLGKESGASVDTVSLVKKGKVAIFNGKEPGKIKFDSFFPKHYNASFCNYSDFPDPYKCVSMIENWQKWGEGVRLIVTDTPINIPVLITDFTYDHKDGTGNLYYSLSMIEKDIINIPQHIPKPVTKTPAKPAVPNKPRPATPAKPKDRIHVVRRGEHLFMLAQKYYGNGWLYKKIKNHPTNQKNYPKLKRSNYIYINWKLVIPK